MGEILKFKQVEGKDVYNPTAPVREVGRDCIAARVEERDIFWQHPDYRPFSKFFTKRDGYWIPMKDACSFVLEDPFKSFVSGELIFGGVQVFGKPGKRKFQTVFFRGECPGSLKRFAAGPEMMKDIRLVELADKRIGVFTRPQGGKRFKRGRIGFLIIDSLEEFKETDLLKAKLLESNLKSDEWEGVNDAKLLESGRIAVLAHRARISRSGKRSYWAISFILDPCSMKASEYKVVATREDFPPTPAKTPLLEDVVFPGELDYDYRLYAGLSDTSVGVKKIDNPYNEEFYFKQVS